MRKLVLVIPILALVAGCGGSSHHASKTDCSTHAMPLPPECGTSSSTTPADTSSTPAPPPTDPKLQSMEAAVLSAAKALYPTQNITSASCGSSTGFATGGFGIYPCSLHLADGSSTTPRDWIGIGSSTNITTASPYSASSASGSGSSATPQAGQYGGTPGGQYGTCDNDPSSNLPYC